MEAAGFEGDALDVALGVAYAESGGFVDAVGDLVQLSDPAVSAKWGPSVGLFQVRSLRVPTAWGPLDVWRRASDLRGPEYNADAAYAISKGGTDWSPWSVYKSGKYLEHEGKDFDLLTGHPRADEWSA